MGKNRLIPTSGRTYAVWMYMLGLAEPFLAECLVLFGIPNVEYYQDTFRNLRILSMTGLVVYLWMARPGEKRPAPAAFWVLTAGFAWIVLRFLLDSELFLRCGPGGVWDRAFEAWFLYFPCALLLTKEELSRCVRFLAVIWGVSVGAAAVLGIYCAATNSHYYTPAGTVIGIREYDGVYRLWLTSYPTVSAEQLLITAAFAMLALFMAKRNWQKLCFGILLAPLFVALGLTDGRTAMAAFGLMAAVAVFVGMLRLPMKRGVLRYGAGLAAALLTVALVYGACGRVSGWFRVNADALPEGSRRTAALTQAEDRILLAAVNDAADMPKLSFLMAPAQEGITIHRQIEGTLSGRTQLWSCVLKALANNDQNMLLVGRTPRDYEEILQSYGFPDTQRHVHNIYLQVLMEWGLPGFAVMAVFLALLAIAAFRLMLRDGLPFWERFLPAPALAMLAVEMLDCFMRLNAEHSALQAGFLFMGLIVGVEQKNR